MKNQRNIARDAGDGVRDRCGAVGVAEAPFQTARAMLEAAPNNT